MPPQMLGATSDVSLASAEPVAVEMERPDARPCARLRTGARLPARRGGHRHQRGAAVRRLRERARGCRPARLPGASRRLVLDVRPPGDLADQRPARRGRPHGRLRHHRRPRPARRGRSLGRRAGQRQLQHRGPGRSSVGRRPDVTRARSASPTCAPAGSRSWSTDRGRPDRLRRGAHAPRDRAPLGRLAPGVVGVRRRAAAAWLVLAWMSRCRWRCPWRPRRGVVASVWTHWLLMVLAMMLPVVAPHVRTVGLRSLWSRRHRSILVLRPRVRRAVGRRGRRCSWPRSSSSVSATTGPTCSRSSLLLAAAWQVSVPRRRVLRRCASLRLRASSGLAADVDCARAGVRSGLRCLVECWPVMLAMALSHSLVLMAGLAVVLLTERARGANPVRRAGRPLEAWVLAGFAFAAVVGLVL